ncbi:type I 3-dehydroquinate dehydratase [Bacilli bacterium]|nr:3-dehydroquinate dehydratase [Bacilli bacterium VT-13-104]PZD89653.1 type I 3-dehydroquinate dehydratase [Bacilli bacterium]PZD91175.1 type I 3-dehydroquinate dehydratase [Bacilli bacterium]PZD92722.1 type I 3-dehydroquinate dehydratase [Bacilli bacterium]RCO07436.1 type I 3-dehydroquinate dehydratase [Bacilli bacterium]
MSTLQVKNLTIGEGVPKIIVPLVGSTKEQILKEALIVKDLKPDVVEWRVDMYEEVENLEEVKRLITELRNIYTDELLLFTFRTHREGGNKEISDDFYVELNRAAILTKDIDLLDIELFSKEENVKNLLSTAKENGIYVVMSNHDFFKTPEKDEIVSRLRKMQELDADIPKIAVMPKSVQDVITLMDATNTMKTQYADRPIITMSMAGTGVISRLAGELFGSAFTFGAGEEASAPGQIPVSELRTVLEILHKSM